jgi:uncharacterized protein (DUF697 family)
VVIEAEVSVAASTSMHAIFGLLITEKAAETAVDEVAGTGTVAVAIGIAVVAIGIVVVTGTAAPEAAVGFLEILLKVSEKALVLVYGRTLDVAGAAKRPSTLKPMPM